MLVYRSKLDAGLRLIGGNPQIGRSRDDLPSTHRAQLVGVHVIVCRIGQDSSGIVRILHQRMRMRLARDL